jgi:hypothetical protein
MIECELAKGLLFDYRLVAVTFLPEQSTRHHQTKNAEATAMWCPLSVRLIIGS